VVDGPALGDAFFLVAGAAVAGLVGVPLASPSPFRHGTAHPSWTSRWLVSEDLLAFPLGQPAASRSPGWG